LPPGNWQSGGLLWAAWAGERLCLALHETPILTGPCGPWSRCRCCAGKPTASFVTQWLEAVDRAKGSGDAKGGKKLAVAGRS
jgi:hypothetical protein